MFAEISNNGDDTDDLKSESDFLTNVPRIERKKVLDFGHGSGGHGRDSRYWDRDDRRRDDDYDEDVMEQKNKDPGDENTEDDAPVKTDHDMKSSQDGSHTGLKRRGVGLYNEAGRHELKRYEAEYEASLKNLGHSTEDDGGMSHDADLEKKNAADDIDDEYDDFFDFHDAQMEDSADSRNMGRKHSNSNTLRSDNEVQKESHDSFDVGTNNDITSEDIDGSSSLNKKISHDGKTNSRHENLTNEQSNKKSHPETKRKTKRRKFSGEAYFSHKTFVVVLASFGELFAFVFGITIYLIPHYCYSQITKIRVASDFCYIHVIDTWGIICIRSVLNRY